MVTQAKQSDNQTAPSLCLAVLLFHHLYQTQARHQRRTKVIRKERNWLIIRHRLQKGKSKSTNWRRHYKASKKKERDRNQNQIRLERRKTWLNTRRSIRVRKHIYHSKLCMRTNMRASRSQEKKGHRVKWIQNRRSQNLMETTRSIHLAIVSAYPNMMPRFMLLSLRIWSSTRIVLNVWCNQYLQKLANWNSASPDARAFWTKWTQASTSTWKRATVGASWCFMARSLPSRHPHTSWSARDKTSIQEIQMLA